MNTGWQPAFLDCAVVELAGQRVIDIKRNPYACTPERGHRDGTLDGVPYPAGGRSAFGEHWIPIHQRPP
ncbi:hypothetical protein EMIT0P294_90199 [Pseudomonas sp. IT-P294]